METFVGWGGGLPLLPCTFCMFFDAVGVGFVRLRSIFVAVGVGFVRLAGCFPRLLRGFFRCRWPEARILRGFVALAGCFPDFYDSFCSPIFKMHEFFHIFCCSANGAWLDWGWGLPENVVRCAFFVALHVGFHGKCSFCQSFWQLLCVFVDRRGGFHA